MAEGQIAPPAPSIVESRDTPPLAFSPGAPASRRPQVECETWKQLTFVILCEPLWLNRVGGGKTTKVHRGSQRWGEAPRVASLPSTFRGHKSHSSTFDI
jgi:hypothetical protein